MMKKLLLILIAIILLIAPASASLMDSWATEYGNSQHNGLTPYTNEGDGTVKWTFDTGNTTDYDTSPVVDTDGIIYIVADKMVHAVYPNGTEKWSYVADNLIRNTLSITSDGSLVFSTNNYLYSIYSNNGTVKWINEDYGQANAVNIESNGDTIFMTLGWTLKAFYHNNGTEKWSKTLSDRSYGIVIDDDTVYVMSNYLFAYYINDGTLKWSNAAVSGDSSKISIGSDGIVNVVVGSGMIRAIYPNNGTIKWDTADFGLPLTNPFHDSNNNIYMGTKFNTELLKFDSSDGGILHSYPTNIYYYTPLIDSNDVIYGNINNDNIILAINNDGTTKWQATLGESDTYFTTPAIALDGTLYALNSGGILYAFESTTSPITISIEIRSQQNSNALSTFINDVDSTGGFTDNNGYITLTPTIASSYPLTIEANLYEGIKLTFISTSAIPSIPLTLTGLNPSQDYAVYESGNFQYEFRSTSQTYFYDITTHDEISSFQFVKLSSGSGGRGENEKIDDDIEDTDDDTAIIILLEEELPIELITLFLEDPIKTVTTLIKNPVNWLIFFGAYLGVLIGMLILPLKVNYADILLYGTLIWVLSLLLLTIGLNLSLNYIFISTSNILGFFTYIIYGLIMSIYLLIKGE